MAHVLSFGITSRGDPRFIMVTNNYGYVANWIILIGSGWRIYSATQRIGAGCEGSWSYGGMALSDKPERALA